MNDYVPVGWLNDNPPAINKANLEHMEQGIIDVVTETKGTQGAFDATLVLKDWTFNLDKGYYLDKTSGKRRSSAKFAYGGLFIGYGNLVAVNLDSSIYSFWLSYYGANGEVVTPTGYIGWSQKEGNGLQYIPNYAIKFGITFKRNDEQNITDSDVEIIKQSVTAYSVADNTLTKSGLAADSKVVGDNVFYLQDAVKKVSIVPELRNGSIGNPANVNGISFLKSITIPAGISAIHAVVDIPNADDYFFSWRVVSYNILDATTASASAAIVDNYDSSELAKGWTNSINIPVGAFSASAVSVAVGIYAYLKADESVYPLRIANVGNALKITFEYDAEMQSARFSMPKNPDIFQSVEIRNGSVDNTANATAVSFRYPVGLPEEISTVEVVLDIPNAEDYYYSWRLRTFSQLKLPNTTSSTYVLDDYASRNYAVTQSNRLSIPANSLSKGAVSFAISVWAKNKSDGTIHTLRYKNVGDGFKIGFIYVSDGLVVANNIQAARNINKDKELCAAVRYNKEGQDLKDFCLLEITDSHSDSIAETNAIQIANGFPYFDILIHCGDLCLSHADDFSQAIYNKFIACEKPFYFVIGNHDVGNSKKVSECITTAQTYTRYIEPLVNAGLLVNTEYQTGKSYYYHDFTDYNIRLIVVNEYDDPNDLDPEDSTNYLIRRGDSVISYEQALWFCQTLKDTPNGYSVIVAMHAPFSANAINVKKLKFAMDFDTDGGTGSQRRFSTDFWAETINAFVTRDANYSTDMICTGDAEYLNTNDGVYYSLSFDFSNAKADFLCFIGGHRHRDFIFQHTVYTYQKMICPVCAISDRQTESYYSDIRRSVYDSPSKDSLTATAFDKENKMLRLVKIGQDVTENMEKRDMECIDIMHDYLEE